MTPVVARLVARWRADPHAARWLRPGATAEQLDAFEQQHGVALPPALRDLYAAVDGSGVMIDDRMINLFPLAEIISFRASVEDSNDNIREFLAGWSVWSRLVHGVRRLWWGAEATRFHAPPEPRNLNDLPPWADRWFIFADYCIASHFYLIRLDADRDQPAPVVTLLDDGRHLVASSFVAFLELWAAAHDELLMLGSREPLPEDAP